MEQGIIKVDETFAFALNNGKFTEAVLFDDEESTDLTEEERAAVDQVLHHVEKCYVGLLKECRERFYSVASEAGITPKRFKTRESTMWSSGMVEVALFDQELKDQWAAYVKFELRTPSENAGDTITLCASVWTRAKHRELLQKALGELGRTERIDNGKVILQVHSDWKQDDSFAEIAKKAVEEVWPLASKVRELILASHLEGVR